MFCSVAFLFGETRERSLVNETNFYNIIINLKVLFYEQKFFYFDGSGDARRRTVMQ